MNCREVLVHQGQACFLLWLQEQSCHCPEETNDNKETQYSPHRSIHPYTQAVEMYVFIHLHNEEANKRGTGTQEWKHILMHIYFKQQVVCIETKTHESTRVVIVVFVGTTTHSLSFATLALCSGFSDSKGRNSSSGSSKLDTDPRPSVPLELMYSCLLPGTSRRPRCLSASKPNNSIA